MARIVVIDASPLIGLAIVDGLPWLPKLLGEVFLPESVRQEVLPGKAARGEEAIAHATMKNTIKSGRHLISFIKIRGKLQPDTFIDTQV
jgi:predicted nucleic acid-binding protein